MYEKVYAPQTGELFEVPHERASLLVLNEGWTKSPPAVTPDIPDATPAAPARVKKADPAPVVYPTPAVAPESLPQPAANHDDGPGQSPVYPVAK